MTVLYFTGFESGDAAEITTIGSGNSIQNTVVGTGGYALLVGTTAGSTVTSALSTATIAIRLRFRTAAIAAVKTICRISLASGDGYLLQYDASGHIQVAQSGVLGLTTAAGTGVMVQDVWYSLGFVVDTANGGVVRAYIGDSLEVDTTHSAGASNATTVIAQFSSTENHYFDDIHVEDGTVVPGNVMVLTRQPVTGGTPTYDQATKSSGTDAGALWDNTPFDTTDFCSEATAGEVQTAILASFGATQTGHGTEVIHNGDNLVGMKIGLVGKTSSTTTDGADSIRRRVGGADTDTAVAVYTTSDAWRDTGIFTGLTYANLTDGTTEIGVKKGTGVRTHTIEDMWLMLAYISRATGRGLLESNLLERRSLVA